MSQTTKNQHYIPQSLLKHFCHSSGSISEALVVPKTVELKQSTKHAMSEDYTYEHSRLRVNGLEDAFGKIESKIAPKVLQIIACIEQHKKGETKISDIKSKLDECLQSFVIFYYRSGALLHEFATLSRGREDHVLELLDKIIHSGYTNALARTIGEAYSFTLIESEKGFLISDQFISTAALGIKSNFSNISNRHIGLENTILMIPISSRYYAVYYHSQESFFLKPDTLNLLTDDQTDLINTAIINNSYVKCAAATNDFLEEYLPSFKFQSAGAIYTKYNSGEVGGAAIKKEVFLYEIDEQAFLMVGPPHDYYKYIKLGRNNRNKMCACNSGKKFKKCCLARFRRAEPAIWSIMHQKQIKPGAYQISQSHAVELPVVEWIGYPKK